MNEREIKLSIDILEIISKLPEAQQQRLLGIAEGLSMVIATNKEDKEAS